MDLVAVQLGIALYFFPYVKEYLPFCLPGSLCVCTNRVLGTERKELEMEAQVGHAAESWESEMREEATGVGG